MEVAFQELPFLTRKELLGGTHELLSVPIEKISYAYCIGGPPLTPRILYYSKSDLEKNAILCARFSEMEGVNSSDCVVILLPMRSHATGPITQYGHSRLGATVIPFDITGSSRTISVIFNLLEPTIISSTPSILLDLIAQGKNLKSRIIETTGEPLTNTNRNLIGKSFNGEVFDTYVLSECIVGVECKTHNGFHYWPDSVFLEIIDPATGALMEEGEEGEIVVTNLLNTSLPIIRYRTGDIGHISTKPCRCGRYVPKVWIKGRLNDTIFLPRGVKIHDIQIVNALNEIQALTTNYQLIVSEKADNPYLIFKIEGNKEADFNDIIETFSNLSLGIMDLVEAKKISFDFEIVKIGSLPRSAIRDEVLDKILDIRKKHSIKFEKSQLT